MVHRKALMDLSAISSVPWAVVLGVCVVGSLTTCASAAPLILQLDSASLLGHRLVIAIEPLIPSGITPTTTDGNTTAVLLNTTANAINGSIIYFDSNSDEAPVTPDDLEMVSADDATMSEPLKAAEVNQKLQARSEQFDHATEEEINKASQFSIFSAQSEDEQKRPKDINEFPALRTRIREMDNVDNFLITFPNRCPPGWKLEHGQCRKPFNGLNDIARPRSKAKSKRKIKLMA
ncbi:unnamed protein product [Meganyctiphanes norvegica]|uniref:Uncharacterized protein n=1 Tax=Meganyctiphanes norvegica TaxID=48144 RepID=A0AAV2PJY2_MEGNR